MTGNNQQEDVKKKDSAGSIVLPENSDPAHPTVDIPESAVQAIMQIAGRVYQGPIPDPDSFERYERSLPGSGDRILRMAEKEQEARLAAMPLDRKREFQGRVTGQLAGFISLCVIVGCATIITVFAHDPRAYIVAGALVATPLLSHAEKITNYFRKKGS